MKYRETIETKDLILRKAVIEDAEKIYNNYWKHEETAKYMNWSTCKNLEEANERLGKAIEFQIGKPAYFVYEKLTNEPIGMAGVKEVDDGVYEDAGIGIGPKFVGKGYGKQILNCLIDYVFIELNGKKLICSCNSENIPSARLQQACGLKFTHREKTTRKKDGLEYMSEYYEIDRPLYEAIRKVKES